MGAPSWGKASLFGPPFGRFQGDIWRVGLGILKVQEKGFLEQQES